MGEADTYFSLSSEETFGSTEKPRVRLWGHGFDRLQFRVYRVNDPLQFFRQFEDPNNFGGQPPRRPEQITRSKNFGVGSCRRAPYAEFVRQQFTQDSRENIREAFTRREQTPAPAKGSTPQKYASVPVLNQQQVVAVWEQPRIAKQSWESQFIPVDVKERGVYLVEATDGKLQAYTTVIVTDLVMITKTAQGTVHRSHSRPEQLASRSRVPRCPRLQQQEELLRAESDKSGFIQLSRKRAYRRCVVACAAGGQTLHQR